MLTNFLFVHCRWKLLTRLRRLNRTSLLPSSCNLDKIFALTGHLAQVHMANKKFPIFLHAGRVKRKGERLSQFSITSIIKSFESKEVIASIAQSAERQTTDSKFGGTNPAMNFFIFFFATFFHHKYIFSDF